MDKTKKTDIELLDLDDEEKKIFLEALGYGVNDEGKVIKSETNKPAICPYSEREIEFRNASILPGSVLVMNTNATTIAEYLTKHPKFRFKE